MNIKEKVWKVLNENLVVCGVQPNQEGALTAKYFQKEGRELLSELTSLIEKERASAVRSFGKWFDGGKGQFGDFVEEYLKTPEPKEEKPQEFRVPSYGEADYEEY